MEQKAYLVSTCRATVLSLDVVNCELVHVKQDLLGKKYVPFYIYMPKQHEPKAFLVPDIKELAVKAGYFKAVGIERDTLIQSFNVRRDSPFGEFCLANPLINYVISAEPVVDDSGIGRITGYHSSLGEAESFSLLETIVTSDAILETMQDISDLLTYEWDFAGIKAMAALPSLNYDALQAVSKFLEPAVLDIVSADGLHDEDTLRLFTVGATNDLWARVGLPRLVEWLKSSRTSKTICEFIGKDLDKLEYSDPTGQLPTLAGSLVKSLRRRIQPQKNFCVVTSARNEGIYIVEWLAHQRALGCEHAFIYTNNNDDDSDNLLNLLHKAGEISLIYNSVRDRVSPQYKAYNHAL